MHPTLDDGDMVLSLRLARTPERGDVIIFHSDTLGRDIVKRVIGLPGDVVEIRTDEQAVYVNGERLDEALAPEGYLGSPTTRAIDLDGPVVVKEGHVFALGDNRQSSNDSRSNDIGQIPYETIIGRFCIRLFSIHRPAIPLLLFIAFAAFFIFYNSKKPSGH